MSKEIKELDMDKYLVIEIEDLDNYLGTEGLDRKWFNAICNKINLLRKANGKPQNQYLVLNLEDEINLDYLESEIYPVILNPNRKIKDIAVALVNAILKAKGD